RRAIGPSAVRILCRAARQPAARMDRRARPGRCRGPCATGRRFHRRHDRPLRHGRPRPAVRRDAGAALARWSRAGHTDLVSPRGRNVFAQYPLHARPGVEALVKPGVFTQPAYLSRIVVEPPLEASHGDLATNAAMVLAKDVGLKPRDLADMIAGELRKRPEV